ncbi:hypothetical protein AVEN_268537-1 [Araneus ventricosus]|uniref:Uncharacterized protein n=1 Tax=Araneus ventricosus TaxID=182803 RepID=A0A4Y2I629_ARAVE|nr:hypothetical protein AVEN_268537-1 [Araneus ventricosus]
MTDLQWKRVSNLEPSGSKAGNLPLGHRGLAILLAAEKWNENSDVTEQYIKDVSFSLPTPVNGVVTGGQRGCRRPRWNHFEEDPRRQNIIVFMSVLKIKCEEE